MKYKILFIAFIFFTHNLYSQVSSKKDTTTIFKTDDYSNFKTPKQAIPVKGTIDIDSGRINGNEKLKDAKIISFDYNGITQKADKLFKKKNFTEAVELYILAFKKNNDLAQVIHRFNAGCCFAMINKADSAFYQLFRIAEKGGYYNYFEIQNEKYLTSLHSDSRWPTLISIIRLNAKKIEDDLNSKTPQNN